MPAIRCWAKKSWNLWLYWSINLSKHKRLCKSGNKRLSSLFKPNMSCLDWLTQVDVRFRCTSSLNWNFAAFFWDATKTAHRRRDSCNYHGWIEWCFWWPWSKTRIFAAKRVFDCRSIASNFNYFFLDMIFRSDMSWMNRYLLRIKAVILFSSWSLSCLV